MDEYRPREEYGSTAEDFIGLNKSYPMYQYSIFLNGSRDEQIVVRATSFDELLAAKRIVSDELLRQISKTENVTNDNQGNGYSNGYANGVSHYNGNGNGQVECDIHEAEIFTVKKDGPNKGRQFKSCTKCRKFLGFV